MTSAAPGKLPEYLYHYYEKAAGPFRSLSDLPPEDAEAVQARIRSEGNRFASRRADDYLIIRRGLENQIRNLFIAKGGKPLRDRPHYTILGACPWVKTWYVHGCEVCIPLAEVPPSSISFTYGDSFPAMRYQDGRPYRGQVYTLAELPELVARFSLPQIWNPEGSFGSDRYIEAQVWDDTPVQAYLNWAD